MRKLLSRWKPVTTGVLVPFLGGGLILFSIWLNSKLIDQSEGAQDLPERVQVQMTLSRIGLENCLTAGNTNGNKVALERDVTHYLDEASQACNEALQQAPGHFLMPGLISDPAARTRIIELKNRLNQLRVESNARYEDHLHGTGEAGVREKYERAGAAVATGSRETRLAIDRHIAHQRFNLVWLNAGSLVIVFGLFSLSSLVLFRELKTSVKKTNELAKLSLVANKTENVVLITDHQGLIEWVNEGFIRLSGRTLVDAAGKSPSELLLGPVRNARTMQRFQEGFASRKNFSVETLCAHRNGQRYWLSLSITPVFNEVDELTNFVGLGSDATARKRAEEELARANRQNELLLHAAGDGIYGLDTRGQITFANPAAVRLTGWDAQELIGKPVSSIIQELRINSLPDNAEDHFTNIAFQDGSVLVGDNDSFRRKDGRPFPVEYTSTPIREGNQLVGTVVVFRDISDRKQAEIMRARQARQYAVRAEIGFALTSGDTLRKFLQLAAETVLKHLDGAFARIWTYKLEENILELQASAGIYTHIDGHHARIPVGTMKVGAIARDRIPQITNDLGNDRFVSDREWVKREKMVGFVGFPLLMENRLVGVVALYSRNVLPDDALELLGGVADSLAQGILRMRAEEKVAEQAALIDKSQDAIVVMDLANRCLHWNKSAERLYGWPANEAYGKTIDELLYRDVSYFDRARQAVLERGEYREECCQVTKGDESVIVETQWTLVQDELGQPKSILIVNTDISERKKIEAQFLRTQRMESIGTLAGGIAHDLNNVLAPIMMSVEILKDKFKDDQSQRMLSIVESSAKRGADMVKQVLTFARGVDGERVLLQTRHLIKEVAKMVSETFPKTIHMRTNISENLWPIMGDATQLHQVMVNLTVNARDAMPEGGTISLSAENAEVDQDQQHQASAKPGFYVVVKVADTGTGIPREVLDKIFEPFFTTKEMGKGTGLGLSTVLGIVKSHGGFVQVQTELNKGTTFVVYLPALEGVQQSTPESEQRRMPTGNGELILAVDDEASVLSMTKETLETYGYRVLTARDGTEAVAAYSAHRAEIKGVLTDMLMPHMDGPATIRVLKKLDPDIKIIAASGLMDSEKVKDATGLEQIAFLMKPYTAESLLKTVHKILGKDQDQ